MPTTGGRSSGRNARAPPCTFLVTQGVTAVTGVHLVRLPPAQPNDPRGPRALSGAVAQCVGRVAPPPPLSMLMNGHQHPPIRC